MDGESADPEVGGWDGKVDQILLWGKWRADEMEIVCIIGICSSGYEHILKTIGFEYLWVCAGENANV